MPSAVFILVKNGLVLMEQRPPSDPYFPRQWVFPGGKLTDGETPSQAMVREAIEELGIQPLVYEALMPAEVVCYARPEQESHRLYPFLIEHWNGHVPDQVLDSGARLAWWSPLAVEDSPVACAQQMARAVVRLLADRAASRPASRTWSG